MHFILRRCAVALVMVVATIPANRVFAGPEPAGPKAADRLIAEFDRQNARIEQLEQTVKLQGMLLQKLRQQLERGATSVAMPGTSSITWTWPRRT